MLHETENTHTSILNYGNLYTYWFEQKNALRNVHESINSSHMRNRRILRDFYIPLYFSTMLASFSNEFIAALDSQQNLYVSSRSPTPRSFRHTHCMHSLPTISILSQSGTCYSWWANTDMWLFHVMVYIRVHSCCCTFYGLVWFFFKAV